MRAVAERVAQLDPTVLVRCAYLELTAPSLPLCVAELAGAGVQSITVTPVFLGVGKHAREDLPILMAGLRDSYPHIAFTLQAAVGEQSRLIELLAQIALSG